MKFPHILYVSVHFDSIDTGLSSWYNKGMIHPLEKSWRITSDFRGHKNRTPPSTAPGIDYAAPRGTPIRAPVHGVVTGVKKRKLGGISMWLTGGSYKFYFAHLQCVRALGGENVHEGQILGYTGNTGRSTGPHLHFSVRKQGEWVDPAKILEGEHVGI